MTKIFFDMDGTIADLYSQENWLESILAEDADLFGYLPNMYTYDEMVKLKEEFPNCVLEIITWTPMNGSNEYCAEVARKKATWIQMVYPGIFTKINVLPYGVPKQYANTNKSNKMILVDDNPEVLAMWNTPKNRKGILRTPDMTMIDLIENIWEAKE